MENFDAKVSQFQFPSIYLFESYLVGDFLRDLMTSKKEFSSFDEETE